MATMDVYDVIGTALAAITGLCHGKKRHNELAEAVTTLVTSLRRGTFVVACTKANAQTVLEASSSSGANVLSTPGGQPEQVTAQFLDPAKVEEILKPTRLALRSKSPKIAEASLQIVQTLIARGLVRGDADAPPGTANGVDDTVEDRGSNPSGVNSEGAEDASEGPEGVSDDATVASSPRATPSSSFPAETERDALVRNTQACEMIDLICGVGVVPDEAVELQMLKCLLTAVSSHSLRVRSKALLRVTRACVNCYLGSASEVVQTTAKASLTQMLVVVFHRLESNGETNTSVAPVIRVSDVFSSQARWPVTVDQAIVQYTRWDTTLTTCRYQSQSFKKSTRGAKTSRAATAAAAAFRKTDDDAFAATAVANFVQGFMDKVASDLTSVAVSVGASSDDTDQTDLGWVPAARGAETVRHVTDTEFDGAEDDATPGKSVNVSDGRVNHIQDSTRVNQTDDWTTKTPENLSSLESHLEEGDVFLVFRALCKLAAKPGDLLNPAVARGKILSLELLRILLENAGPRFRSSTRLTSAVSEYLCDAVVVCASQETLPAAHGLALCAFCAVVKNFRPSLKAEIGVFFPALLLEPLVKRGVCETNPQSASGTASSYHFSYQRKCVLLQCARELLTDVTVLADMFVNYDCDMDSQNLFEKFVDTLAFVARWGCGEGSGAGGGAGGASVGSNAAMPAVHSPTAVSLTLEEQRMCASLRLEALELLRALVETLREWVDSTHGTATESHGVGANAAIDSVTPTHGAIDLQKKLDQERERDGSSNPNLVEIQKAKLTKTAYQHAIALFNTNPKKGLVVLQQLNKCGPSASEIAVFLKHTPDLDKTSVGDFLGERDDGAIAVMHAYVDGMDFSGYKLDEAIRVFLAGFRLPGESQKIDRLMEKFAQRFCLQNPGMYRSPDTAYVLSFSTIMLNTDAHNPGVKHKMTKEGFVKNNRGIDDGGDVAAEHLEALYDRIVQNEIIMKDSDTKALAEKAEINASKNGSLGGGMQKTLKDMSNRLGVDLFTSLMTKPRVVHDVDTSVFMATVRERAARDAASGSWHTVHDPLCAKPMFDAFKDGVLRAFDTAWRGNGADSREKDPALQEANSEIVTAVLTGYVSIAQLAASANAFTSLDEIVQALTEMAAPKPPAAYKPRNVLALRFLVEFVSARQPGGRDKTARDSGNALTELNWAKVLATASRYDFTFSASAGFDESVLFASLGANGGATCAANPPGGHRSVKAAAEKFSSPFGKTSGPVFGNMFGGSGMGLMFGGTAAAAAGTTDESPFAHLRKGQVHATDAAATTPSIRGSVSEEERVQEKHAPDAFDDLTLRDFVDPGFEVLKTFTPDDLDVLYHASVSLDGDAVVRFTKALCRVSLGELSSPSPRVFSLTKLVEVASLNSARVRFVWVKMWCVMAEFFVKAGCHADVNVAMYAVDSLRQLAVKFLADRKELKLYSFQNDFMKPFVEVMKASRNPEIREFLVRCVSQIITTQAGNVRSGWRSVFAVFTAAASDANLEISRMAFEIVERVIREHFAHITETDPSTFVECVTCLIAFTGVTDPVEEHFGGVGNEKGNGGASAVSKNRNRATKKTDPSSSAAVISLNAIAFLRFCALKLADGEVGDLEISKGGVGDGEYDFGVGDTDTGDVPDENRPQSAIQSLKSIPTAQRKSKGKGKGVTAFTDRETHVYFWFPLLHGLSTLAHDDRREIRGAALQVLFDILNFHGQHFSPGFWCRVFHEILLPVFDGGRAKELSNDLSNDSTPQDGSDNDQVLTPQDGSDHDQDRWLFQTCQHCLDGVVDLFAKFYPSVATKAGEEGAGVLRKLTALLASLASRPHAELAACGVGAMHRLTGGAGSEFDWNAWRVVVKGGLVDALLRTTTSLRLFAHRDSAPLDIAPRAFQSKAATARLLTNALAETYFRHGDCLDFETLTCLVDALVSVAKHAKQAAGEAGAGNNNTHRTDDSFMTCLAVETEARRATLAVLLHLHASGRSDSDGVGGTAVVSVVVSSPAQVKCGVATRTKLVELVVAILTYRFADQSRDDRREPDVNAETDAAVKRRYDGNKERALAPLVADALRALARLDDESFRDALFSKSYGQTPSLRVTTGYDALVALVGSASTPPETRAALCDVFQRRVAPLAARAASGNGVKLGVTD